MADRLSIDKKYEERVVGKVDEIRFLGLDSQTSERIDLFMFALGLGIREGKRTPLKGKKGFILEGVLNKREDAYSLIYSLFIEELRKENQEDKLDDKDYAYTIAEEYANTGFQIMASWFENDTPNVYYFIKQMDQKYEEYFERG